MISNFHTISLSQLLGTITFASNACRCAIFSFLSLSSANAETVRGAQRELSTAAAVNLSTASDFAILPKTGISTVPASSVTCGDIGVSPITSAAMTGFSLSPVVRGMTGRPRSSTLTARH
jgi:hypothetical protein